jgi:SRSO17 transposase
LAFYRAYSPGPVPVTTLVRVAGTRWRIEDSFASAKELTNLDQHQVRRWISWQRWTILAMLAHAFLSVMAATEPAPDPSDGLIALTRHEIRRLFTAAINPNHPAQHTHTWSVWRRRHQARARRYHYQRQARLT